MEKKGMMKSPNDLKRESLERSLKVLEENLSKLDKTSTDLKVKERALYLMGQIISIQKKLKALQTDEEARAKMSSDVTGNVYTA